MMEILQKRPRGDEECKECKVQHILQCVSNSNTVVRIRSEYHPDETPTEAATTARLREELAATTNKHATEYMAFRQATGELKASMAISMHPLSVAIGQMVDHLGTQDYSQTSSVDQNVNGTNVALSVISLQRHREKEYYNLKMVLRRGAEVLEYIDGSGLLQWNAVHKKEVQQFVLPELDKRTWSNVEYLYETQLRSRNAEEHACNELNAHLCKVDKTLSEEIVEEFKHTVSNYHGLQLGEDVQPVPFRPKKKFRFMHGVTKVSFQKQANEDFIEHYNIGHLNEGHKTSRHPVFVYRLLFRGDHGQELWSGILKMHNNIIHSLEI